MCYAEGLFSLCDFFWWYDVTGGTHVSESGSEPKVVLYSKAGCHLCDETRELLDEIAEHVSYELDEIDIRSDLAIFELYRYRIPVVLVNGTIVAEGRIEYNELAQALHLK
jgi:hypothetical protein